MNGIEVLKQIRADDPRAPVIVLTGGATDSREIQARGLGVTEFLRKGLPLEALVKTMDKVLARSSQAAEATADPSKRVSLLVVDDEEPIRSLLSRFLTQRGYRVRVAKEGQEALTLVAQEAPQMVITDIYMR
jgi:CheY-like chemotaxis protein